MNGGTFSLKLQLGIANATRPAQGRTSNNTLPQPAVSITETFTQALSYGTSAGYFEAIAVIENTLAGAGTVTYDLYDGSINDVTGVTMPLRTLQYVAVYQIANTSGAYSTGLTIGNAASNAHALWFGAATHTYSLVGIYGVPFIQGDKTGKTVGATTRNVLITNADAVSVATYVAVFAGRLS